MTMTQEQAIDYVLQGGHPGNCIDGARTFSPNSPDERFDQFISEDIPEDWYRFRRVCHLLFMEAKCRDLYCRFVGNIDEER